MFCCHRFQIWCSKHPVGAQRDDSGPRVGDTGLRGFCFAAIDSRSDTPNIPLGHNGMIQQDDSVPVVGDMGLDGSCFAAIYSRSGPVVGNMGLDGSCFAAIYSRSGSPNILLGLNVMILGPVLVTRVFTGSVLRQLIPDLAHQTSRWGTTR